MGKALTCSNQEIQAEGHTRWKDNKFTTVTWTAIATFRSGIQIRLRTVLLTLYRTTQTKMLRGIRKKFMIVLLDSSGMYCDLIFMIDGQKIPTHISKRQNPSRFKRPPEVMVSDLWSGRKNCNCQSSHQHKMMSQDRPYTPQHAPPKDCDCYCFSSYCRKRLIQFRTQFHKHVVNNEEVTCRLNSVQNK